MERIRVVFMGTADLAGPVLRQLARQPFVEVVGVVTQPDRPKGRDLRLAPPPVKIVATELSLPVFQPERLRHTDALNTVSSWSPDLIVVAAYGQILPQSVLDLPRWGCLNVHASILPKYRGASPIQWAILHDESETGITIMKMDAGLDTGAILSQQAIPILPSDTAQTLHDRLAQLGAELLVQTIPGYIAGRVLPKPQPAEGHCYARKITKDDGRLQWQKPARELWNQVRAFNPWPGSFTQLSGGAAPIMLKVWSADLVETDSAEPGMVTQASADGIVVGCGSGALKVTELQREGKRRLKAADFLAGTPIAPGQHLD
jgi:methionyl-tRNA formyltransferase